MTNPASLSIRVRENTGTARVGDILLGGIPMRPGLLKSGGFFHLTSTDGVPHPVEGTPAAYWPDGSIKWLHLCGPMNLAGGQRNDFTLTPASPPKERLTVEPGHSPSADRKSLRITGSDLEVEVGADIQNLLAVQRGRIAQLIAPGLSGHLALKHPAGDRHSTLDWQVVDQAPQVVVHTANRVVLRLAGKFTQPAGRDVAELILFVEVFRQSPEIRLQPVFIYLGNEQEDAIAALDLIVHVRGTDHHARFGIGGENGRDYWDVVQQKSDWPAWPQARLIQSGSSFFRIDKRTGPDGSWTKAIQGRQSDGWIHLAQGDTAVTAAMRYFWQEYPRALSLDAATGRMTFHLVPPWGEGLDLRRYSPNSFGSTVYETGCHPIPATHGARGIAKASELMLRFERDEPAEVSRRAAWFRRPARIEVGGAAFAESGVVGPVAPPRNLESGPEEEIAKIADFLMAERDRRGWYGLMDFGDIMESFLPQRDTWAFDVGGYAWINSESLPDLGLLLAGLRHERIDWLEAGLEMCRHNRDVDGYHRGPLKGLGTRHHINHWGDEDKEWRVSMPYVRRLHYYLTADVWTAETIRQSVEVYQSYDRTCRTAPSMTSALAGLYVKWDMSGDPADGRAVWNLLAGFAMAVRPDGAFSLTMHANLADGQSEPTGEKVISDEGFFLYNFAGQHLLVELAELLKDQSMLDAIIRHVDFLLARRQADEGWVSFGSRRFRLLMFAPFMACAWRASGRENYRKALRQALKDAHIHLDDLPRYGRMDEPSFSVSVSHEGINKLGCELAAVMNLTPYALSCL